MGRLEDAVRDCLARAVSVLPSPAGRRAGGAPDARSRAGIAAGSAGVPAGVAAGAGVPAGIAAGAGVPAGIAAGLAGAPAGNATVGAAAGAGDRADRAIRRAYRIRLRQRAGGAVAVMTVAAVAGGTIAWQTLGPAPHRAPHRAPAESAVESASSIMDICVGGLRCAG